MTNAIYAVERRDGNCWSVVGETVFTTREAAEHFEETYVETDLGGTTTTVDVRIVKYAVDRRPHS